ncbi:MAG: hypothetical protein GAK31_02441 [Stenotrophomonas maltophilia]|uniref:Uncharacterized protein n=1 Tax=Stenotrophomonas maltophilia TaxID=40324 RepID=A0A7V8FGA9_STEMA|nr:MAG: hypothetical protein GAK31_02441 [Stenotrophomonas maltophilia]
MAVAPHGNCMTFLQGPLHDPSRSHGPAPPPPRPAGRLSVRRPARAGPAGIAGRRHPRGRRSARPGTEQPGPADRHPAAVPRRGDRRPARPGIGRPPAATRRPAAAAGRPAAAAGRAQPRCVRDPSRGHGRCSHHHGPAARRRCAHRAGARHRVGLHRAHAAGRNGHAQHHHRTDPRRHRTAAGTRFGRVTAAVGAGAGIRTGAREDVQLRQDPAWPRHPVHGRWRAAVHAAARWLARFAHHRSGHDRTHRDHPRCERAAGHRWHRRHRQHHHPRRAKRARRVPARHRPVHHDGRARPQ